MIYQVNENLTGLRWSIIFSNMVLNAGLIIWHPNVLMTYSPELFLEFKYQTLLLMI